MQSRRRRKKAGDGRCRFKIEATSSSPVFGQTKPIEDARGSGWKRQSEEAAIWRQRIRFTLSRFAPRTVAAAPSGTDLNLNVKTMMSSDSVIGNGQRHITRLCSLHRVLYGMARQRPEGGTDNHSASRCDDLLAASIDTMRARRDEH
jgi:hypothetical protein